MGKFFIAFCNGGIKGIGKVLQYLVLLLPPSPFKVLDNSPIAEYLQGLNYFVPINEMVTIGEVWLAAISVFYIYQIGLRWAKAIE